MFAKRLWVSRMGARYYIFERVGINPRTGEPLTIFWPGASDNEADARHRLASHLVQSRKHRRQIKARLRDILGGYAT